MKIELRKNYVAKAVLIEEYKRIGGRIFADFFYRIKSDDEERKNIEASDFLNALLTGGNLKKEWELRESEDYKKLINLVATINSL